MELNCSIFISEASRILGVSQQTLRIWEKDGRITSRRIGHFRVFDRADVEHLAAERLSSKAGQ
jgi:excisionase family DNA binding protein